MTGLELAHDEDLAVRVGQAPERAAQRLELLLGGERRVGRRVGAREAAVVWRAEPLVDVVGQLLGAAGTPERVDARVLGDLVDPGLERDLTLGGAHAAQGADEDLLRHVLRAPVVLDHPEHEGVDAPLIALVERLEGPLVPPSDRGHQLVIGALERRAGHAALRWFRCLRRMRSPTTRPASLFAGSKNTSVQMTDSVRPQTREGTRAAKRGGRTH